MPSHAVRDLVRQRAGRRCEYCHLPDECDLLPFQIDHVIAQQHSGPADPGNLAWACLTCNHRKGPNLSSVDWEDGTARVTRLYNPREDDWADHFEWDGAALRGRTPIGRSTIHCLGINLKHRIALRKALMAEGAFGDETLT